MNVTSEIKFTDVKLPEKVFFVHDRYVDFYDPDFHPYIMAASTRYCLDFVFYKNDTIIGPSIYYYGEYTQGELQLLDRFIKPGYVIYDIGANIGYHTLHFANWPETNVYAFEPNNKNYKLLKYNTRYSKNVTCINAGISDNNTVGHITDFDYAKPDNLGEMKLSDVGQECKLITLDDCKLPEPHIIKIDVEGHEDSVFRGAKKMIENSHPIIFYEAMHTDLASIYDMLSNLGYHLYWVGIPNYNPHNYRANKQNIFGDGGVINILALPFYEPQVDYLHKVIGRDDTYQKLIERVKQKQNAKSD
jgi:FkbM family methyltransferase